MSILLTGATGYIGSHTAVELLKNGYDVIIVDNLCNSDKSVIDRIKKITNKNPRFYEIDIRNKEKLKTVFSKENIESVIHFAGYKAVGESVKNPLMYYENNIGTTICLLDVMDEFNVKKIIFSSSATVYGPENEIPYVEGMKLKATSPYGNSKIINEMILEDWCKTDESKSAICLRYFNPIGAHSSGLIGEMPHGVPNNLMPYIQQVASGIRDKLYIFGNDYNTVDGTGVRDYLHVVDLAIGHIKALEYVNNGFDVFNLGTGKGTSVLELIKAFEDANNIHIPYEIIGRRAGDIAEFFANSNKAHTILNWEAKKDINEMCKDAWNWEKNRKEIYE